MPSLEFTIDQQPVSKERPRVYRGKTITPEKTKSYEKLVGTVALFERPKSWPLDAEYALDIEITNGDKRRRDIDNQLKAIMDGLNKILWNDDSQVVDVRIRSRFERNEGGAYVHVKVVP